MCLSPPPPILISSHRTRPLEVEVTRATRRRRTPPPPPSSPTATPRRTSHPAAPHRLHVTRHRRTPNHSQGWVIGIVSLLVSYLRIMSTSATEARSILDITKTFLILWILLDGGYGLGRFLDLVYRINLVIVVHLHHLLLAVIIFAIAPPPALSRHHCRRHHHCLRMFSLI
jgi:hypothetical protein